MAQYLINILIAIDQLATVILGGFPDETLSSYAYRLDLQGKPGGKLFRPLIDWLFSWQRLEDGHCKASYDEERLRLQFPPELR
jgi:hypothetical protein